MTALQIEVVDYYDFLFHAITHVQQDLGFVSIVGCSVFSPFSNRFFFAVACDGIFDAYSKNRCYFSLWRHFGSHRLIVFVVFRDFSIFWKRQMLGIIHRICADRRRIIGFLYVFNSFGGRICIRKVISKKQIFEYEMMTSSGIVFRASSLIMKVELFSWSEVVMGVKCLQSKLHVMSLILHCYVKCDVTLTSYYDYEELKNDIFNAKFLKWSSAIWLNTY